MDWQRRLARLAAGMERRLGPGRRRVLERVRGDRVARVAGYSGYGTPERVHIRGRVLYGPAPAPAAVEDRWWVNLANAFRRIESDEVAGARLQVEFLGATTEVTADWEGHFHAEIRPADPVPDSSFWHHAGVELLDPSGQGAVLPVAIPIDPRFGIISDLDDTVLQTDVQNLFRMVREVLFGNAHTRVPFPGVGAFYRALHAGSNPLFYVSSSPWNLYDLLEQFLELHRIPAGPMDLRDWGLAGTPGLSAGHHGHKRNAIDRILRTYPDLRFILVGDSGQEDPEIYRSVVHDHPQRVLAIYIRSVVTDPGRAEAVTELSREMAEHDIELLLAHDTLEAAHHAAAHGWIDPGAIREVDTDRELEVATWDH